MYPVSCTLAFQILAELNHVWALSGINGLTAFQGVCVLLSSNRLSQIQGRENKLHLWVGGAVQVYWEDGGAQCSHFCN